MFFAAVRRFYAFFKNPSLPCFIKAAQVPAVTAPDREPAIVGVTYIPPDQFETGEKVKRRSSFVLKRRMEQPLGPKQYL